MLVTKVFHFDGAHKLLHYKGKCENLHGHTWALHVTVSAGVDERGIAFDFLKIKKIVEKEVLALLDHSFINDVIENPSAENIALWSWDRLKDLLPLEEIKVFETPTSFVTYRGS